MGRHTKILDKPNCLQLRLTHPRDDDLVNSIVDWMIETNILEMDMPLTIGYDDACDVVHRGHYHLSGFTRYTQSKIKSLRKQSNFDFGKDLVITSKVPTLEEGSMDKFLRYSIKDTIVRVEKLDHEWITIHSSLAKREYQYKLDTKRKHLASQIKSMDIYQYLDKVLEDYPNFPEWDSDKQYAKVREEIIMYAVENMKEHYLDERVWRKKVVVYLGNRQYWSRDRILEHFNIIKSDSNIYGYDY